MILTTEYDVPDDVRVTITVEFNETADYYQVKSALAHAQYRALAQAGQVMDHA